MTARAAATAAGKRAVAETREAKRRKAPGGPAKRLGVVRRSFTPANPRRVSGPVHGRGAPTRSGATAARSGAPARAATPGFRAAATARAAFSATAMAVAAAAEVAPRIVRPAPRIVRPAPRITRPGRDLPRPAPDLPRTRPRPAPRVADPARRAPVRGTRGARALGFVRGLPDHSLIDRLVRGRAWIPVLGVLLVGIVAMQVSLLQLNASMGRAIEQSTTLQTQNGQLRAQVASLGAVSRIERVAASKGMVMATPAQMTFLSSHAGGVRGRAIANMIAPSSTALGTIQAASSTSATSSSSTVATSTSGTSSTPSTITSASTTGAGTGGTLTPTQTGATTSTPSTTAATPSTAGTGPTTALPPAAGGTPASTGNTGTTGGTTASSGGASYTATGG